MVSRGPALGRLAYGALFLLGLPLGLAVWARAIEPRLGLPAVHLPGLGWPLVAAGIGLMGLGMQGLMRHGRGLPMNAFPPPLLVRRGVYAWLRHPIYLGAGLLAGGLGLLTGSAAALWLVTPLVSLGGAALAHGHERHDLRRRFGAPALAPTRLSLPPPDDAPPSWSGQVAVYAWALLPWLLTYLAIQALGRPADAFQTALGFERRWPVWQWTEALYASAYLLVPLTPLLVRRNADLRRFAQQGITGTILVGLCWITVPVVAANRAFTPTTLLGHFLAFEQRTSAGVAAFPAFHVLWSLLAAQALAGNARGGPAAWSTPGWSWAVLITLSCLTTGAHTLIEVAAAVALFLLLRDPAAAWERVRRAAESRANAWREWRVGPVRIISHGGWAALAAGTGALVSGAAVGTTRAYAIGWLAVGVLLGAGLWAQALEGSSRLLRPFGWYGGVVGGVLAAFLCHLRGIPVLSLLAALSVAAPWIQLLGRLRCLVQGCCHGGPADAAIGIRYCHRRSRVTQIAGLGAVPLHPTPLYSIAGNAALGLLLLRLRLVGCPEAMLVGAYLVLGGMARFTEEGFRAEPQTPVLAGLRIYQWFALATVLAGLGVALVPSAAAVPAFAPPTPGFWLASLAIALVYGAAMGVDFPGSNRRFSRLAAAD